MSSNTNMATSAPCEHIGETKSCEDDPRFLHAEVVYWWQEENLYTEWWNHSIDKYVSDALQGSLPDNFDEMKESYDEYVGKLYKESSWRGSHKLENWQRWQKSVRSDLECVDEFLRSSNSANIELAPIGSGYPKAGRPLEGCSRLIYVTSPRTQLGEKEEDAHSEPIGETKSCEDDPRFLHAEVVYCFQKWTMSGNWDYHPIDKAVADALLGSLPDNFDEMKKMYDSHLSRVNHLYDDMKNNPYWKYGNGQYELENWERWHKRLRSDLKCVNEFLRSPNRENIEFAPIWGGCPVAGRELEGCFRCISVISSRTQLGEKEDEVKGRVTSGAHVPDAPVRSWADVLKSGPREFRNPIQEAKLAVEKENEALLAEHIKIWENQARQRELDEKYARYWREKKKKGHWLQRNWWEGEQVREDMRRDRLDSLRFRMEELQRRMQNTADHSDYWHGGHDARLNSPTNTEYNRRWKDMEYQMDYLDSEISNQEPDRDPYSGLCCYDWTE